MTRKSSAPDATNSAGTSRQHAGVVRGLVLGSGAPPACPSPLFRDGGSLLCRQLLRTGLAALEAPETPKRDGGWVFFPSERRGLSRGNFTRSGLQDFREV